MIINQTKIIKPWGYEIVWSGRAITSARIFGINRGQKVSKNLEMPNVEAILITAGTLVIESEGRKLLIKRGQSFYVEPLKDYYFSSSFGDTELVAVGID